MIKLLRVDYTFAFLITENTDGSLHHTDTLRNGENHLDEKPSQLGRGGKFENEIL